MAFFQDWWVVISGGVKRKLIRLGVEHLITFQMRASLTQCGDVLCQLCKARAYCPITPCNVTTSQGVMGQ